jgi:tuftelin-interacting protein 11
MTGKDVKILHGYETLSRRNNMMYDENDEEESGKSKQKKFDLPELLHNLELLVNMTEEKIVQSDKK